MRWKALAEIYTMHSLMHSGNDLEEIKDISYKFEHPISEKVQHLEGN